MEFKRRTNCELRCVCGGVGFRVLLKEKINAPGIKLFPRLEVGSPLNPILHINFSKYESRFLLN